MRFPVPAVTVGAGQSWEAYASPLRRTRGILLLLRWRKTVTSPPLWLRFRIAHARYLRTASAISRPQASCTAMRVTSSGRCALTCFSSGKWRCEEKRMVKGTSARLAVLFWPHERSRNILVFSLSTVNTLFTEKVPTVLMATKKSNRTTLRHVIGFVGACRQIPQHGLLCYCCQE